MHRPQKRAIRLTPSGQINLRKRVIDLLGLQINDRVMFILEKGNMYLYKDNDDYRALRLRGRTNQLSAQSVDTVRSILTSCKDLTAQHLHQDVELTVFRGTVTITVDDTEHQAVKIINRL